MALTEQERIEMWDEYRAHLVREAQKVWQYAMSRDKWQRYFKNLTELERSQNVTCLRNQVSDAVYQSLVRAQKRYEAWGSWRWVLLAFTSVGRKVSLYHYLCFDEKLRALSEKAIPDLNAMTALEMTLIGATERLSWGSKTRVILQNFWGSIKAKTTSIKYKIFGIVPYFPDKKVKAKRKSSAETHVIVNEEEVLNSLEAQDIKRRCDGIVPASEPFVSSEERSTLAMAPYRNAVPHQIVSAKTKKITDNYSENASNQYRARYALLRMVIYREMSRVERIFLEASTRCRDMDPSLWGPVSAAIKKEANDKLQELLNYLTPAKHSEACIIFKKEVIEELKKVHTEKDGSVMAFDIEAELALLGYERDRGIDALPDFEKSTVIHLADCYQAYVAAWNKVVKSRDVSEMEKYAITSKFLRVQQENTILMFEQAFIQYYRLLSNVDHDQKMSQKQNQLIQLLEEHDRSSLEQTNRLIEVVSKNEECIQQMTTDLAELKAIFATFTQQAVFSR